MRNLLLSLLISGLLVFESLASNQESTVSKISPREGSTAGSTMIFIDGKNFAETQMVSFSDPKVRNQIFLKSSLHSIECDVVPTSVSPSRIQCETRAAPTASEEWYHLYMTVDDKEVGRYCGGSCTFRFSARQTPTVTKVVPRTSVIGKPITISGKIFTHQFSRLSQNFDPDRNEITRIFVGDDVCDPINDATNELYGSSVNEKTKHGWFTCKPKSKTVASNDVAYIVREKGITEDPSKDIYLVDKQKKLYVHQSHADVEAINPNTGSIAGGTRVNISGVGFGTKKENINVTVGGVPCNIETVSNNQITCVTGPESPKPLYPGNRGLLREAWTSTEKHTLSDIDTLLTTAADYFFEILTNASNPEVPSFNKSDGYSSRFTGFFDVPWDDWYTFYIVSDDKSELHMSTTGNPADKVKIAECKSATHKWNKFPEQKSSRFKLTKGQVVYLHALHVDYGLGHRLTIGVSMDNVSHPNAKIASATDEKQTIQTTSVVVCEKQIIDMTNWKSNEVVQEVQEIELPPCGQINQSLCNETFQLTYKEISTSPLPLDTTAQGLETALNGLSSISSIGSVSVSMLTGTTFKVEFSFSDPNDVQLLTSTAPIGPVITIRRMRRGLSTNSGFRLRFGGSISGYINASQITTEKLEKTLKDFFSVDCTKSPNKAYHSVSFEDPKIGPESGERTTSELPYCGRTSLKNPHYIYRSGYTKDRSGKLHNQYNVGQYKYVCFAYKGPIRDYLNVKFTFIDKNGNNYDAWRFQKIGREAIDHTKWRHVCINMYDTITKDNWVVYNRQSGTKVNVHYIYFMREPSTSEPYYIDEFFIGSSPVQVLPISRPAMPKGYLIESFSVTKESEGRYSICMKPVKCGQDIPFLSIDGSSTNHSHGDHNITYAFDGITSSVSIGRTQSASPPITGTFNVTFQGTTVKGIPANVTGPHLKRLLEERLDVGTLKVERSGTCAGFKWIITWISKGGNHSELVVDNKIHGNEATIKVTTNTDGQLYLRPIPGEFLRTPHNVPQVAVMVNDIPSSCIGQKCSFNYSQAQTPTLTALSPSSVSVGSTLTLTGTGFSTDSSLVNVTIGGVPCDVTANSETSITCTVGNSPGGKQPLNIHIKGKGNHIYTPAVSSANSEVTVLITISSINPDRGSTAGGTEITIQGQGFSNEKSNLKVTVDGSTCDIISATLSEIKCSTPAHAAGATNVLVAIGDVNSNNMSFTYDAVMTASVTSVSPLTGRVSGGETITIAGSGFGNSTDVVVKINDASCILVTVTDTEITCKTPSHKPGSFPIKVSVPGKGYPDIPSSYQNFQYILKVTSISPLSGSIAGGTEVTITGTGFSDTMSDNVVKIGGRTCNIRVESSNDTTLVCITDDGFNIKKVTNMGTHPEVGKGYAWSPNFAQISIGDSIKFEWAAPRLTDVQYKVFQTNENSDVYDGSGFQSSASAKGSFTHQFTTAGTYHFSSGPIGSGENIVMNGKVEVDSLISQENYISVTVSGFPAACEATAQSAISSTSCNAGVTTLITGCELVNAPAAESTPNNTCMKYTHKKCLTPIVTEVSPNTGNSQQDITINGTGFSETQCQNIVMLGSHVCTITSNSETNIKCKIDLSTKPKPGETFDLSLVVKNRGKALIQPINNAKTSFKLIPRVISVTPSTGSQGGGTTLILKGDGFSELVEGNTVRIGSTASCTVKHASYTTVECVTVPSSVPNAQDVILQAGGEASSCTSASCRFTFSTSATPQVSDVQSSTVTASNHELTLLGNGFGTDSALLTVTVGDFPCAVSNVVDNSIKCRIAGAFAGQHSIKVLHNNKGLAVFQANVPTSITVVKSISSLNPTESSNQGGLTVDINGFGFNYNHGQTSVKINNKDATIVNVSITKVIIITPANTAGNVPVVVTSGGVTFPSQQITYSQAGTPEITSISPSLGQGGSELTLSGSFLTATTSSAKVKIGSWECVVNHASSSEIKCTVPGKPAGKYPVSLIVEGKGKAKSTAEFSIDLSLSGVNPTTSGHGGGRIVTVTGSGFSSSTVVKICNNICIHDTNVIVNDTEISCEVPQSDLASHGSDSSCAVSVTADTFQKSLSSAFIYSLSLTSRVESVSPARGGTGGGVTVTIKGSGFSTTKSDNKVTIDGVTCVVQFASQTEIQCKTGSHTRTIKTKVRVEVGNNGRAVGVNDNFYYVDLWSSIYSWGGKPQPGEGAFVVIRENQTMVLDVDTPILKMIVIQGGKLKFDNKNIHLQSHYIFISDNGILEIGTEEEPFQHKAIVTLHGHVRSKEIPAYGTKGIGLRQGTIDMHGKHVSITWTRLSETAAVGANTIKLQLAVPWEIGDEIVIAATGRSERENEQVKITAMSDGGKTLTIDPPLKYKHISMSQTIEGQTIETRAEVGLLTRNVVVQGSVHDQWTEKIQACEENFRPGQFQTQTCFQGKFGDEVGSDEFGVQIMIHAPEKSKNMVTARFSHIEVRNAGQAFRLGRYPIHFHTSGRVDGSYVKGCAIHHSFNRAITMHGVHNLVVERNVVFDILGNAIFMEDGIEEGNIVQYNLGVFVKPSTSTLNVDITPAIFWVTNANNTIRHNVAAGGTHFGFWYQMFKNPDGPSFDPNVCPRNIPMKIFKNNTAHSFGRYGLWVFPTYHPMRGGGCNDKIAERANFTYLLCWNNMRGAEVVDGGAVSIQDSIMLDNDIAGIEYVRADLEDSPWEGALIKNTLIIARSNINEGQNLMYTKDGIRTAKSHGLLISNVTMVNFNKPGCRSAAIQCCSQCKEFHKKGGFETRFEKMKFVNSPCRTRFQWEQETLLKDLDGSMTGHVGGYILPKSGHLPPENCNYSALDSHGEHQGMICDNTVTFRRVVFHKALPDYLLGKNMHFTNKYGTSVAEFNQMGINYNDGWQATLIVGLDYNVTFVDAAHLTNITYHAEAYDLHPNERIILNHNLFQTPDHFETTGEFQNMTDVLPGPNDRHGKWAFNNDTKRFTYHMSHIGAVPTPNGNYPLRTINLRVFRCYYLNCITPTPPPPPKGRPADFRMWSKPQDWADTEPQYGGYGGVIPKSGENVMIPANTWMVVDSQPAKINKLFVEGALEIDGPDGLQINATFIFVTGSIIVGWPDNPYTRNVLFNLMGGWSNEDNPQNGAPNAGTKSLTVFGNMYFHGQPRKPYWTKLATTASAGSNEVTVVEAVEWVAGDEIVITSTTKEPRQSEVFKIVSLSADKKNITLSGNLTYTHKAVTHTAGTFTYTLAGEVGLLTRNIKIVGVDDPTGSLTDQDFGGRVLVAAGGDLRQANARIENVEFKDCGQLGWTDSWDPRYSLAIHGLGDIVNGNSSYVRGNSINRGFNTGIGIFETNKLTLEDNVIYYTIGSSIRDEGNGNTYTHNLAIRSEAFATYKGRKEELFHYHGCIENHKSNNPLMFNNTVSGCERFGYKLDGEPCADGASRWYGNEVHGGWHGIHIGYKEGITGCSKLNDFLVWENLDYGIFVWPKSSLIVSNLKAIDNTVALMPNVWGPNIVQHETADKFVILRDSLLVGKSPSYNCSDYDFVPEARKPYLGDIGPKKAPGGGRIGVTLSFFCSSPGGAPSHPWEAAMDYSAIYGRTKYERLTCANYGLSCGGKRDIAIITNEWVGDILHPTDVSEFTAVDVDSQSVLHFIQPGLQWINPSDCVDMPCDARRQILITDLDGSLTGSRVRSSIISKAEYQWNGDPRYGLGDYRIPKPALTRLDGSRINVNEAFPNRGIIRGTKTQVTCDWKSQYNGYQCTNIDHLMLIIESLDEDTETRRLSPVHLSADGYVNLLNGPMDHGWCLGYTCQERVSTFYGIIAAGRNYSLYFTSTEPQKVRFHLINSRENQSVRIALFYKQPQRQDVYWNGRYMYPTNADVDSGQFKLKPIPVGKSREYWRPIHKDISGANYYDNDESTLYFMVKGPTPVDIRTSPVVQVTISTKAEITVDEFFKKNLIENLANLLGCDISQIRFMEVVSASKRRRRATSGDVQLVLQIANNPAPTIDANKNTTITNTTVAQNTTGVYNSSFDELKGYADKVVEVAQTGELAKVGMPVTGVSVVEPIPPPVDPTGGVRATNGTGGSANGSMTYDQLMAQQTANKTNSPVEYLIPCKLVVDQEPSGANETVPFTIQPRLKVLDCSDRLVTKLGGSLSNWTATVRIRPGTGDPYASINGTLDVVFVEGYAYFTDLSISHSGIDYILEFTITKPTTAKFNASSTTLQVKERELYYVLIKQPSDANETTPFGCQPAVEVRDRANGQLVTNTGWKGRKWLFTAALVSGQASLNGSTTVEFINGVANFTDLSIDRSGNGYKLNLTVTTSPESNYHYFILSNPFDVRERLFHVVLAQQPGNCNDTVLCGDQPWIEIRSVYPDAVVDNIGWKGRRWFIIVTHTQGSAGSAMNATTRYQIPTNGRVEMKDLYFLDVSNGHQLSFRVETEPVSSYTNMTVTSDSFNVNARQFYLEVTTGPRDCNQSMVCGVQPVVEVFDVGTGKLGLPLKEQWFISVALKASALQGTLQGTTFNVSVVNGRAQFNNLSVSVFGEGYILEFFSNYGHKGYSAPFEVKYINDYSPLFQPSSGLYMGDVIENATVNTLITTVAAVDHDTGPQGDVYYSITGGNIGDAFKIHSTNGALRVKAGLDRETVAHYTLIIKAQDGAVAGKERFTMGQVSVNVTDINDNTPKFDNMPDPLLVMENVSINGILTRILASDLDAGINAELTYKVLSGNEGGYFVLDEATGNLKANKSLDLEALSLPKINHTLVIEIADKGSPPRKTSKSINIMIAPVNEFTPQLSHPNSFNFTFTENVSPGVGVDVYDVNATDNDYGENGDVTYHIQSGNDGSKFTLDSSTGQLKLTSELDYETTPSFTLVIQAQDSDSGGNVKFATFTVYVTVIDVNDNTPTFAQSNYSIDVPEDSALGSTVATVTAVDPDAGNNGVITYSIIGGNSSGVWYINTSTGALMLNVSQDLDSPCIPEKSYMLVMKAEDGGVPFKLQSNTTITMNIKYKNEYPPVFSNTKVTRFIPENAAIHSFIYHVQATDADCGPDGEIEYTISSGNDGNVFAINSTSGNLSVASDLDRETKADYLLSVQAADKSATDSKTDVMTVIISLDDVNDNTPTFTKPSFTVTVNEDIATGSQVADVRATDSDSGLNGQITYSITSGNERGFFVIEQGFIKVAKNLDIETETHYLNLNYRLEVQAIDKGTPPLMNNVTVDITILGVNEFTPVVVSTASSEALDLVGSFVYDVNATDGDQGTDGQLRYTIKNGNENDEFSIDDVTGVITVKKQLNAQTKPIHTIQIQVIDQSTNITMRRTALLTLTVNVKNSIPSLSVGNTWIMPVNAILPAAGLCAVHIIVQFDTSAVEVQLVETAHVYDVNGNTLQIFSHIHSDDSMKANVAMVTFKWLKSGTPTITIKSSRTVDRNLVVSPTLSAGSCPNSAVSGDVNNDCAFDILDVAFIAVYKESERNGFPGDLGTKMKGVISSQKTAMDVDLSQAIDEDDCRALAQSYIGRTRFLNEFNITIPDHTRNDCEMRVRVQLKTKSGQEVDGSKTDVFLDIAQTQSTVHSQMQETTLSMGSKAAMKNNRTFFGGILKASFDSQSKAFIIVVKDSKLSGTNIGLSIIQVVTNDAGQKLITPMFKSILPIYHSGLDVTIDKLRLQYKGGYSPQRMIDFQESTERCFDPYETHEIEITFDGDFGALTAGGHDPLMEKIEKSLKDLKLGDEVYFNVSKIREGSIIATLHMTTIKSQTDEVTKSLHSHVVKGISVTHNGKTIVTQPHMTVGGKEYIAEKPIDEGGLTTTNIIIIVISIVLLMAIIIAIVLFLRYRNNKKIQQTPPTTPDQCWKEDIDNMKMYVYEVNAGFDKPEDTNSIESINAANELRSPSPDASCRTPKVLRAFTEDPIQIHTPSPSSLKDSDEIESQMSQRDTPERSSPESVGTPTVVVDEDESATEFGSQPKINNNLLIAPAFEILGERNSRPSSQASSNGRSTPTRSPSLPNLVEDESDTSAYDNPNSMYDSTDDVRPVLYKTLQISLLRPNVEMGTIAHCIGTVKANVLGTLEELRTDINAALPRALISKRYLFVSKRLQLFEPWSEEHTVVKSAFSNVVRVKALYGTERCEEFCPCGGVAKLWCNDCNVQGYCKEECREADAINHVTSCKKNKSKQKMTMAATRLTAGKT